MDERENARYWEENAPDWVRLVRKGFDESRDLVNSPAFFAMLPDVRGLAGLDLGCGEGHNTRQVAARGARMAALDVATAMLKATADEERREPRGIRVVRGSGLSLPFADGAFDFVTAFMSLMDMPDHTRVIGEVHRVLRPGGFFQLSITHPCFQTPMWEWLRDENGRRRAVVCGDYFRELDGEIEEWSFSAARRAGETQRPFRIPRFTHTLSTWLNLFLDAGFALERFAEPTVDAATLAAHPQTYDHRVLSDAAAAQAAIGDQRGWRRGRGPTEARRRARRHRSASFIGVTNGEAGKPCAEHWRAGRFRGDRTRAPAPTAERPRPATSDRRRT